MAKLLCVLYPDPVGGYPKSYARDGIPEIERYSGCQTTSARIPTASERSRRLRWRCGAFVSSSMSG